MHAQLDAETLRSIRHAISDEVIGEHYRDGPPEISLEAVLEKTREYTRRTNISFLVAKAASLHNSALELAEQANGQESQHDTLLSEMVEAYRRPMETEAELKEIEREADSKIKQMKKTARKLESLRKKIAEQEGEAEKCLKNAERMVDSLDPAFDAPGELDPINSALAEKGIQIKKTTDDFHTIRLGEAEVDVSALSIEDTHTQYREALAETTEFSSIISKQKGCIIKARAYLEAIGVQENFGNADNYAPGQLAYLKKLIGDVDMSGFDCLEALEEVQSILGESAVPELALEPAKKEKSRSKYSKVFEGVAAVGRTIVPGMLVPQEEVSDPVAYLNALKNLISVDPDLYRKAFVAVAETGDDFPSEAEKLKDSENYPDFIDGMEFLANHSSKIRSSLESLKKKAQVSPSRQARVRRLYKKVLGKITPVIPYDQMFPGFDAQRFMQMRFVPYLGVALGTEISKVRELAESDSTPDFIKPSFELFIKSYDDPDYARQFISGQEPSPRNEKLQIASYARALSMSQATRLESLPQVSNFLPDALLPN